MSHKYKVKMTSHNYPIGKIKNMVTKYQKEQSQGLLESVGELIKDFKKNGTKKRKRRKRKKRTRKGGGRTKKRKSRRRKKRTRRRKRKKR